jgi:DNA-directed RNA polymerase specialized sigma24 family protein
MPDDATLVERCLHGDTGAFDALVARYRDRVFSLAFRILGEASAAEADAMQEAFLRAYTRLPLLRPCATVCDLAAVPDSAGVPERAARPRD